MAQVFRRYKNMNSSFVAISTLINNDIGEKCPINVDYLECTNTYKADSPKKKTDVIEKIVYGCITNKLNQEIMEVVSTKQANQILSKNQIIVKSLSGYRNAELKKIETKPYVKEKPFIKV